MYYCINRLQNHYNNTSHYIFIESIETWEYTILVRFIKTTKTWYAMQNSATFFRVYGMHKNIKLSFRKVQPPMCSTASN